MAGNTCGTLLQLTTFGESHGEAIGGILDGLPSGISLDLQAVQYELNRRRPGQSALVSPRNETDVVQFLSGIFEGKLELPWHLSFPTPIPNRPITTIWLPLSVRVTPILLMIKNTGIAITAEVAEVQPEKPPVG